MAKDNTPTGRTLVDLIVELPRARYLWYVLACVVAAFLVSWVIIHAIAEPGSQVSVWSVLQYTKKKEAPSLLDRATSPKVQPKPQVDSSPTGDIVVEFSSVRTDTAPGGIVAAAPYLHRVRIAVEKMHPQGSELVLINNRFMYEGRAIQPELTQNFLTQINTGNVPASFVLVFSDPLDSLSFTRPALFAATKSGVTHPAWSAHALDANGNTLSSQTEGLIRSFTNVPSRTYTLNAPGFDGIAAVRFDSDPRLGGEPFAGFSALLIERLNLARKQK